jgi:hypothetical protein
MKLAEYGRVFRKARYSNQEEKRNIYKAKGGYRHI